MNTVGGQAQVIHRLWMGRPMPDAYEVYGQMWKDLNPEWNVIDWDEAVLDDFPEFQNIYADLRHRDAERFGIEMYVQLADILGYALVERWGGVYVNCDIQPVRPLPRLPHKAWASYENNEDGRIVNCAIGAPQPNDPFWKGLLDELPSRYFSNPADEMVMTTGPGFLTDYAHANPDDLHVFPLETFNPVHWKQIPQGGDASSWIENSTALSPLTIGVHHWGHKKDGRSNHVGVATQP